MRAASVRFSVHTSDERFPVSGRIANGSSRKEMFLGAAVMIALVADGDDDAGLIVVPAMGGDAGALAQLRARAVGGHQQARLDDIAVGERHGDAVGTRIVA